MQDKDDNQKVKDYRIIYQKVKTNPIMVKLLLVDGTKVEGYLHQPHTLRLTDMLNRHTQDSPFLAVTDAHVIFPNGEHLEYKFFTVNRTMILCCFPDNEEVVREF